MPKVLKKKLKKVLKRKPRKKALPSREASKEEYFNLSKKQQRKHLSEYKHAL